MIGGKRYGLALTAKDGSGVTTVSDDNLIRRDNSDNGGGSDGLALRLLKLATTVGSCVDGALDPRGHLLVHAQEAPLHRPLPLLMMNSFVFYLLLHHLMEPLLTLRRHLKKKKKGNKTTTFSSIQQIIQKKKRKKAPYKL